MSRRGASFVRILLVPTSLALELSRLTTHTCQAVHALLALDERQLRLLCLSPDVSESSRLSDAAAGLLWAMTIAAERLEAEVSNSMVGGSKQVDQLADSERDR